MGIGHDCDRHLTSSGPPLTTYRVISARRVVKVGSRMVYNPGRREPQQDAKEKVQSGIKRYNSDRFAPSRLHSKDPFIR
jgi:hypothetical protein